MDKNIYKTKQKQAILTFIEQFDQEHFTAHELKEKLNHAGIPIGTATIYRHLDKFVSAGVVKKYVLDNKTSAIYEYTGNRQNDECQFHVKCDGCGALIHVECNFINAMKEHLVADHSFNLDISKTVFYGKCMKCSGSGR